MTRLRICKSADLCPDHGSTFRYPPERLTKVPAATHKRHLEIVLVDVMGVICRREDLQQTDSKSERACSKPYIRRLRSSNSDC